ncbi:MAG: DUF979 family protein, partial [Opitutae bacterium]|nr:DUF979 family protein [Opitutae bacterium]
MKPLLTVEAFYVIIGAVFASMAGQVALDKTHARRWGTALFWGLLAVTYLFGRQLPPA